MKIVFHATAAAVAAGLVVLVARGVDAPSQAPAGVQSTSATKAAQARPRLRDEVPASIRLDGVVAGFGDATSATLTVAVGGKVVRSQAITLPGYSVDLPASAGNGVVTLAMEADDVRFTSVVGTYAAIAARAGADHVLTVTEWDAIRLDPVSTAFEFFVTRAGGTPRSDIHIDDSARSVYGADIATAAAVLARLARGEAALPAGYAYGYELLADEAGYASILSQTYLSPDEIAAEIEALPFTAFTADEVVRSVALLDGVVDRDAPMLPPLVHVMEPAAPGLHHLHGATGRPAFASELRPSGELELVPTAFVGTQMFGGMCPSTGTQIQRTTTLLGENQRILRRGMRADLRLTSFVQEVTSNCPELPVYTLTSAGLRQAVNLRNTMPWGMARQIEGVRTLPRFCVVAGLYLAQCDYAPHAFKRGGVGMATELASNLDDAMLPAPSVQSATFSWYLGAPQVLHVSNEGVNVRYWKVDAGQQSTSGLVYVAEALIEGEAVAMGGHVASIGGGTLQGYGAVSPVGTWALATFGDNRIDYGRPTPAPVRITRTAAGLSDGWQPARWELHDGRLYESNVLGDDFRRYRDCTAAYAAGAKACMPQTVRYFRPTARRGARLYGIEEIYTNFSDDFEPPYQFQRIARPTYHELD